MRQASILGLAVLIACAPSPDASPEDETGDEPLEPVKAPEFLEPASGEIVLATDRDTDLDLMVRGIQPGITRVLLDEQSVGTATDETSAAQLSAESLTLRLTGAMVAGEHAVQLSSGGSDAQQSEPITIFVGPPDFVSLTASMREAVAFEADVIDAQGHGEQGVLYGLDLEAEPVMVTLAPSEDDGWDPSDRVTLELPGFDRTDEPRYTATAMLRQVNDTVRVRLAWRSGEEGRVMLGSDVLWPPASIQVQEVVDLSQELQGYEYTRLGRPLILGDTLVVEALLTQDVELPAPGSRTLLVSHIDVETNRFGTAQRSAVGDGRDIDRIEPVRDLPTYLRGGTPGLCARSAGIRAVVYEVDGSAGTLSERPSGASDRFSVLRDASGPMHTIVGSLQSRHVLVPLQDDGPRVFLRQFDDRPRGDSRDVSPSMNALDDLGDVTAPIASTVIAGLPVFLIPQGRDAPVVAIISAGAAPRVLALDGLACDELAVPITPDTAETEAVQVACRRGRDVHLGTIQREETP